MQHKKKDSNTCVRMNRRTIITAVVVALMSVSNVARAIDAEREIKYCERQTEKALQALQPYDFGMMPRNILQGQTQWNLRKAIPEEWCSGFWTGILWMDYAHSRNEAVKRVSEVTKIWRTAWVSLSFQLPNVYPALGRALRVTMVLSG